MNNTSSRSIAKKIYYILRPLIPRSMQLSMRRRFIKTQIEKYKDVWPILEKAATPPKNWKGWPENKKFALVLTHDVELQGGHDKCPQLMKLEMDLGFRSCFYIVPERYNVDPRLRAMLVENGFEVGLHGLNHDGKLYESKETFLYRAGRINEYMKEWNAVGFRSPAMHHNLEWIHNLNIEHDASTFDTDPFEPQPDGAETIFPFWVKGTGNFKGYVELPYTLPQDFALYIIMQEKDNSLWKNKVDWIVSKGGMVLLDVHPDYINFDKRPNGPEEFPLEFYSGLLEYIKSKYEGQYWHVLPQEMAKFWRENYKE